jgi:uracil-DNA glycosylase
MNDKIKEQVGDWWPVLQPIFDSQRFAKLKKELSAEYKSNRCFPVAGNVFRAFDWTQFRDLRVVILGQDPYHNGIATGLAFATNNGKLSPSLRNIVKELHESHGKDVNPEFDSSLEHWARQGVLLINTSLTVRQKQPNSHKKLWEGFTLEVLKRIRAKHNNIVFVGWGKDAQSLLEQIQVTSETAEDNLTLFPEEIGSHWVLTAPHPAAESYSGGKAGFFGCKHFVKINEYLDRPINFFNLPEDERRDMVPGKQHEQYSG